MSKSRKSSTKRTPKAHITRLVDHDHLLGIVHRHPDDYRNFGNIDRDDRFYPDCSGGCRWNLELAGELGKDWGVCSNPQSHRCGLLTFEHQGCNKFEKERKKNS